MVLTNNSGQTKSGHHSCKCTVRRRHPKSCNASNNTGYIQFPIIYCIDLTATSNSIWYHFAIYFSALTFLLWHQEERKSIQSVKIE